MSTATWLDKYIGDAIMALYNVPFEAPDHAAQAVRTALEFQRRLTPLAERFAAKHRGTLACGWASTRRRRGGNDRLPPAPRVHGHR